MGKEDQIKLLAGSAKYGASSILAYISLLIVIVSIYFAINFHNMAYIAISFFVALVGISLYKSGSHLRRAVRAIKSGTKNEGQFTIVVKKWTDTDTYHAICSGWEFEFVPIGWKPDSKEYSGQIFHVPGVLWPALIIGQEGIIYPKSEPKKI